MSRVSTLSPVNSVGVYCRRMLMLLCRPQDQPQVDLARVVERQIALEVDLAADQSQPVALHRAVDPGQPPVRTEFDPVFFADAGFRIGLGRLCGRDGGGQAEGEDEN